MTNSSTSGIKSFGAYIPRRRMLRSAIAAAHAWSHPSLKGLAKGERSICNWDEDVITMAVEAGRDCLRGSSGGISGIVLASTTAPYADLNNAMVVGAALSLPTESSANDCGGSTRSGLSAVIGACRAVGDDVLVVASEQRTGKPASAQEMNFGCGAGAVTVGTGEDVIAKFLGAETLSVPFINSFRKAGERFDYGWEERWIRDEGVSKLIPGAAKRLLSRLDLAPDRTIWFGMSGGGAGADKLVAKVLQIAPEQVLPDLQAQVGDTGTAQPILLLISALERAKPGDIILIASFAQGGEIAAFEMTQSAAATGRRGLAGSIAQRIEETAYLKLLAFDGHVELEWGMRAETDNKTALTQLYRSADQILGFVGGQCSSCHQVQFPRMPACVNCGALNTQKPYSLLDVPAKVQTYTADWLQYTPAPPLYVGLVQFEVGARVLMEIVDVGPQGIDVGTPLEFAFRIKEQDRMRHFDRYFWKAVPVV